MFITPVSYIFHLLITAYCVCITITVWRLCVLLPPYGVLFYQGIMYITIIIIITWCMCYNYCMVSMCATTTLWCVVLLRYYVYYHYYYMVYVLQLLYGVHVCYYHPMVCCFTKVLCILPLLLYGVCVAITVWCLCVLLPPYGVLFY